MKIIKGLYQHIFLKKDSKQKTHEHEIRHYTKEAIRTYKKTLRKLAHE